MDLNLNLGLPICPPPLSVDLGYDLALDALPFSSSDFEDDALDPQLPSIDALDEVPLPEPETLFEPFDLPLPRYDNDVPPIRSEERRISVLNSVPFRTSLMLDNETLARTGGPTLRPELLDCPELRFHRLIESRERWEMARTRSGRDDSSPRAPSPTDPERLMRDIRRSGRLVGSIRKRKATDKAPQVEDSAEEETESGGGASDFDCNICFEVAKEPVVTCCGHLFCWPCLYQWLHLHCDYKECPVCKGKVNESNLVPIYGRGSSEASGKKKNGEDENQGLKIPPRPQGSRVESLRQQLQNPLLRRSDAWIQEVQELFNGLPERLWSLRSDRGEDRRNPPPVTRYSPVIPATAPTSLPQDGRTSRRQNILQGSNPAAVIAELRGSGLRREQPVTITVSEDSRDPVPSPSQTSTSSTMAMIQGEFGATDASQEPNRGGGTSMVLRRRTRSRPDSSSVSRRSASHLRQRGRLD